VLRITGLWTESETLGFSNLNITVPAREWDDEKTRFQLERTLCAQVASAAGWKFWKVG
jgi:hypothetical protein